MAVRLWLIVLLLTCQPAMAGQRILLICGLMDYLPGISPMRSLQARLTSEGYDVTMITHLTDGFYKNAYWDAVIGHSQGAIDALRDAPELARYNPQLTIVTITRRGRVSYLDAPPESVTSTCIRANSAWAVDRCRVHKLKTSQWVGCTSHCPCGQTHRTES